jgi:NAD(P)-dependent dehydrogenase (short-subunit alcohol dehydrogenase family)
MAPADRVALVTGGASGLGAAAVRALQDDGMKVVVLDRSGPGADVDAHGTGDDVTYLVGDVTSVDDVCNAVETAAAIGPLRVVVNTAGVGQPTLVLDGEDPRLSLARCRELIEVNLVGTLQVLFVAARAMAANEPCGADAERGVFLAVASTAAYDGSAGTVAYSASKAGIVGTVLPAARELGPAGIRVCGIAPGPFDTPMHGQRRSPEKLREISQHVVYPGRAGHAAEFAALVLHMVNNPYVNGTVIRLDAGERAQ